MSTLLAELKRRKVFKVGAAYVVIAWLVVQAASIGFPVFEAPPWALRVFIFVLMLGFPIALVMAWVLDVTPEGLKVEAAPVGNKRVIAIAMSLAVLAVGWYWHGRNVMEKGAEEIKGASNSPEIEMEGVKAPLIPSVPISKKSIAVLPFVNMSKDADNEFFSDGMSEEILNSLARIDGMQVVGRTSSFQFKGKNEDLRRIGEQLGVANVLEGSVRRGKDRARITAQLIRVADGIHLWSQTYDRTLTDTLAVQLDIAENVAGALEVVLDEKQRERMREAGVKNVDAFIAFQKARKFFGDAHDPARSDNLIATLRLANVEFAKATALEPDFALAHYLGTDLHNHIVMSDDATGVERDAALEAVRRGVDLAARSAHDPQQRLLIEADRQLTSDDWRGLAGRLEVALAGQGCRQSTWFVVVAPLGFAEARLKAMLAQMACDPLSQLAYYNAAGAANWAGHPEQALEIVAEGNRAMGGSPTLSLQGIRALVTLGRIDEARAQLATLKADTAPSAMGQLVVGAAVGDDVIAINERLRRTRQRGWNPELWPVVDGLAEALAGDRAAGNRRAAAMDALPGGSLKLAVFVALCQCGAPFDLDATPNFKARLAESGLSWPPPDLIANLRRKGADTR